ncbi:hypothetical protein MKI84_17085 [Ancylobacter sp. A5.8]|uniref:hypothetical protein n=1 Tax=Ancylobacter gelatini TaxID=2919920 RepID=UPI001F4DC126|nr:hypothetical protein [Ancylobacter gelatini]MCJ8144640.1 hypothetical protein [Ancylobacter gelatini]
MARAPRDPVADERVVVRAPSKGALSKPLDAIQARPPASSSSILPARAGRASLPDHGNNDAPTPRKGRRIAPAACFS